MEAKIKKIKTSFNATSNEEITMKLSSNSFNQTTKNNNSCQNNYSFIVPWQQQAHVGNKKF